MRSRNALSLTLRILLGLLSCALAAQSASAQTETCPRFAAGSVVTPPLDLYSQGGVLTANLTYQEYVDSYGNTRYCYLNSTGDQSPTLHVNPGDLLVINLTNDLPPGSSSMSSSKSKPVMEMSESVTPAAYCGEATMDSSSVNMHFHGTNISPVCHQDEAIHTLINSGDTFTYSMRIPSNEPPGMYWYHPHVHGIAESALLGGASGAIEVEGIENSNPAVTGLPQQILVVRDAPRNTAAAGSAPVPTLDLSLNYIPITYPAYVAPIINMPAGQRQFWRVINASADTVLNLEIQYDGKAQILGVVALDGVPTGSQDGTTLGKTVLKTQILVPPAGRAEFIFNGPSATVKSANFLTVGINTGTYGYSEPTRPLASIVLSSPVKTVHHSRPKVSPKVSEQLFAGLRDAKPTAERSLYFSESPQAYYITVDGQTPIAFNPDNPPSIVTNQGAVEDWTIENQSGDVHEFHIHQIHFLLEQVNGVNVPLADQQMLDTVQVPFWTGTGPYPSVKVRMDFRGSIVGQFVYHCHIMSHEDFGMMAIIQVNRSPGPGSDAATPVGAEAAVAKSDLAH